MEKIKFDKLRTSEAKKLIGGFSEAYTHNSGMQDSTKVNNCNGGNFVKGCGKKFKVKKLDKNIPNGNCVGNCVAGCGTK